MSVTTTMPEQLTRSAPLSTYPGMNRFALDYVRGEGAARRFLCRADLSRLSPRGTPLDQSELAADLTITNRNWNNDTDDAVAKWLEGRSVALIAGQQVGIAGGPLYTAAKIASLIRMRAKFRERGIDATIFFWLATEDHDFEEIAQLMLWSRDGIERIRAHERPRRSVPVGPLEIPTSLRREIQARFGGRPWTEAESFRDSFALLVSEAFAGEEIVLVDALLPSLRRAAAPVIEQVVVRYDEAQAAIEQSTQELVDAGYKAQITHAPDCSHYTLLFLLSEEGERLAIRREKGDWSAVDHPLSLSELQRIVREQPERLSTSALTRPLVQDHVFRPEIFMGGPAEVAYYAQLKKLRHDFSIHEPAVALRGHALVAPSRVLRTLEKYGVESESIFTDPDELLQQKEPAATRELAAVLDRARTQLEAAVAEAESVITSNDLGMRSSVDRSKRHLAYHLRRLEERGMRAIARRDRERFDALSKALSLLAPEGTPQDRVLGWITFWNTYGRTFIEGVSGQIEPDADVWKIIGV